MKKALSLVAAGLLAAGAAQAGTLTVANSDIEMTGGVTAGYFYATNNGKNQNNDYFTVSSFAIDLTSKMNSTIGFTVGFGASGQPDILDETLPPSPEFDVEYAWVSIRPIEGLTIDAGKLTTNIGYELYHTYDNPNYLFGAVWYGQPFVYPGARVTYSIMDGIDIYAEYTQQSEDTVSAINGVLPSDAFAIGSIGSIAGFNYAVSYFDYSAFKNLVDVVLSTEVAGIELGTNIDYQWLDDTAKKSGKDDSAYGIALYASAKMDVFEIPVRIEYVNDGTSGIYSVAGDDAWTFTITPTWKPTKNTFLRAEFSYISTDKKGFQDDNGNKKDNRTVMGVEAGFVF
ncbi:outer membrane beta-barrel protein [Persephonella sp.]|uniref:outer membrane beta-barrel protein n=1 Tax=Persephonella sp. TaxID=2060922 RepID=UPI00260C1413|nr:outer membrane beta-barrel protein [Persephonella sp.]